MHGIQKEHTYTHRVLASEGREEGGGREALSPGIGITGLTSGSWQSQLSATVALGRFRERAGSMSHPKVFQRFPVLPMPLPGRFVSSGPSKLISLLLVWISYTPEGGRF